MEWPNSAPFAAAITFDMDADSLIHAADPEGWKRPYAISMGQYGPTVGVPRILETALTSGAWFATLGEIAAHAESLRTDGFLPTIPFPTYSERQT